MNGFSGFGFLWILMVATPEDVMPVFEGVFPKHPMGGLCGRGYSANLSILVGSPQKQYGEKNWIYKLPGSWQY